MDYLRTLGSAAVSSLVQKSGLNLPFSLGQRVSSFDNTSIWTLYDGTKRDDGSPVSIFEFDGSQPNKRNVLPLAKNTLRKLRVMRHPDVLKFMDAVETDTTIYIMTEPVRPLAAELQSMSGKSVQDKQDWLIWGLHRITTALAFVNDPGNSTHGSVRIGSIFLSTRGEWRLGGFEVLSSPKDEAAVLYTYGGLMVEANSIASPEVKKSGWSALKDTPPPAADGYALALLIHTLFNPDAPLPPTVHPPHPPPQASSRGAIPASLFPFVKRLLNPNPKTRMTAKMFLEVGMTESASEGGFFKQNRLLRVCEGLDGFGLMAEGERLALLRTIKDVAPTLPPTFSTHLILPSLLSSLGVPALATSASSILPLVIQLGKNVPPDEYSKLVLEPVIKLFESPDRGTRMALLEALPEFADKLDKKMVVDKVWPNLQTGFSDTVAVIREATVKSIGLLSDKFSERILNNDLLRHLARLQSDPEPSIRTNACILVGRLGPNLGYNTKRKVLIMAFAKALKDEFVHARVAGIMAFMACVGCFEMDELAGKVVGCVAGALVDKEKLVRDQAFKAIEMFIKRLETHAATMPETAPQNELPAALGAFAPPATNGSSQATIASSAAGAAGALAGWAISSLGKKITSSEMQSSIEPAASGSQLAPPPVPSSTHPALNSSFSAPPTPSMPSIPTATKPKPSGLGLGPGTHRGAMKLGGKKNGATLPGGMPAELADELDGFNMNGHGKDELDAWGVGDGDLIDVNADEDDWSAFESAPTAKGAVNAVGLGFGDTADVAEHDDEDPWGAIDTNPAPTFSSLASHPVRKHVAPAPKHAAHAPPLSLAPSRSSTLSPALSSQRPTPISSPKVPEHELSAPHAVSTVGMSKEEKAAEMARRKEERKQRIAQLKEQKKVTSPKA